jgi:seryl-tRNA synthetase
VAAIPSLGTVVSQSMTALEVTKEHVDLSIRIENAEKARQRLLALLEKAEKVEDTLKIETEVRRLTEEIERMKGELKLLSERIAFSAVEVTFRSAAPEVKADRRARSRFDWINRIGVENALGNF